MKHSRFLLFVLTIATLLLSACAGTAATSTVGGGRVEPMPVAFIGSVDSIAGDQWVINGQTVTVPAEVIQDGPFAVGDQVRVEGSVNADGSLQVSRVELPTSQDSSSLPAFGNSNSNDDNANDANASDNGVNSNDDNSNGVNSNDGNTNDDNGNGTNTNDDNGNDSNANDDNGGNDNTDDGNSNDDDDSNSGGSNDNGDDDNNDNDDDDDDDDNGNDD